jgi:predicted nuclease of predicted toxin-antitoxin system
MPNWGGVAMKLLLDEMYAGLKEYFETLGYDVLTAQDAGLKAAKDRDVVDYAGKHGLLLVTQDQKPAELAELLGVKCVFISNLMIAQLVDRKIKLDFKELR